MQHYLCTAYHSTNANDGGTCNFKQEIKLLQRPKATITWCHERWWNRQTTDRELDIFRIELVYHKITTELRHRWKRIVQRCDITKWSWKNLQFQTTNKALSQTTDDYYMVSGKMLYVAFCQVGFPRMNLKSSSVEHDVAKNKEERRTLWDWTLHDKSQVISMGWWLFLSPLTFKCFSSLLLRLSVHFFPLKLANNFQVNYSYV